MQLIFYNSYATISFLLEKFVIDYRDSQIGFQFIAATKTCNRRFKGEIESQKGGVDDMMNDPKVYVKEI